MFFKGFASCGWLRDSDGIPSWNGDASLVVAAQTTRAKVESVGINAYTCDPSEIACYLATVDQVSNGRAVLGFGIHTHDRVEWTGIDASTSITRTREATHIIRALLRGEVVDFEGDEFHWTDRPRHTRCYPATRRRGHALFQVMLPR
ncbi:MAG: LLM class flavin-dependent oxidoreductase [Actinobacteria bacterium]|nr:LLM class flavin-dependent oxidoreductase [Actinomycetota bacterium]